MQNVMLRSLKPKCLLQVDLHTEGPPASLTKEHTTFSLWCNNVIHCTIRLVKHLMRPLFMSFNVLKQFLVMSKQTIFTFGKPSFLYGLWNSPHFLGPSTSLYMICFTKSSPQVVYRHHYQKQIVGFFLSYVKVLKVCCRGEVGELPINARKHNSV